jgi:hypothetical protein
VCPLIGRRHGTGPACPSRHAGRGGVHPIGASATRGVTAENAGAAPLIADRTAISPWEEFDLINQ